MGACVCRCVGVYALWGTGGPVPGTCLSRPIRFNQQSLFWNDIKSHDVSAWVHWETNMSVKAVHLCQPPWPDVNLYPWIQRIIQYMGNSSSHYNGRKQSQRDSNGEGRSAALQKLHFITREIKISRQSVASGCLPPPTPFFRWYLLRPTDLLSDYIKRTTMARDMCASRVWC